MGLFKGPVGQGFIPVESTMTSLTSLPDSAPCQAELHPVKVTPQVVAGAPVLNLNLESFLIPDEDFLLLK